MPNKNRNIAVLSKLILSQCNYKYCNFKVKKITKSIVKDKKIACCVYALKEKDDVFYICRGHYHFRTHYHYNDPVTISKAIDEHRTMRWERFVIILFVQNIITTGSDCTVFIILPARRSNTAVSMKITTHKNMVYECSLGF